MPQVGAAIAAVGAALKGFAATTLGSLVLRAAGSVALSLLARSLAPKPRTPGIRTSVTTTGGTVSQAFILGRTATAGHMVAPPFSSGTAGGTPNAFLHYVIELSDIPGIAVARVIVDDDYSDIGAVADPTRGLPLLGQRRGGTDHAWLRVHDGTQTEADAMLVAAYGDDPLRPWGPEMIGAGTAYAVVTFRLNRSIFSGLPQVRFEVLGIPLYDPRFDTSAGGAGDQRWDDPATWVFSENPAVMIYNILRGIRLPDGRVWGGEVPAEDLPLANWFAAMTACDAIVGDRVQFRAGFEVRVAEDEPAAVIEELLKACCGQIAEYGGVWRLRIGPPAAPSWFLEDGDIVISDEQGQESFPGLEATHNAISASYPEPASLWQPREAPVLADPDLEAADGGRRLIAELSLPACPYLAQVGQLMQAYLADERRFRSHTLVLPPAASVLEPLDTLAWTSARHGYAAKIFEVVEVTSRPGTLCQELVLRERDPGDFAWDGSLDLPPPPSEAGLIVPPPRPLEAWSVTAVALEDATGAPRRPALRLAWEGARAEDAPFVRYEVRVKPADTLVASGVFETAAGAGLVAAGLLPGTAYEARGQYVLDPPGDWSAWLGATTPDIRFSTGDLAADVSGAISAALEAADTAAAEAAEALATATALDEATAQIVAFRVEDGPVGALLQLVAANDPSGPVSVARIAAADILLQGSVAAEQLVVTDFSGNLLANGAFRHGDLRGWAEVPEGFWLQAVTGAPTAVVMAMASEAGEQAAVAGILPVQPGESFGLGLRVAAEDAGASGSVALRVDWRDAAGTMIASEAAGPVSPEVDWQEVTGSVAAPAGARSAEVRLVRAAGGIGVLYATGLELLRQRAGATLIRPGSITSAQILAGSLSADDIRAGKLSTEFLDVASLMRIDVARAGLAVGKSGPDDLFTPGVYLGTDAGGAGGGGGSPGFAFLAGRVKDGIAQYVRIGSATGLRLLNARHAVTASLVPNAIDLTASQSYDLPIGTTRISLQMMGGGGAGESVSTSGTRFTGGAGGLTRVELWDGGNFTGLAWEAAGALGGGAPNPRVITAGESSPWGTGGTAAWRESRWIPGSDGGSTEYTNHPAQNATGFGAGGGGGRNSWSGSILGYGGSAAPLVEVEQVDVAHLALPRLVITVGAAGLLNPSGPQTAPGRAGNGAPGRVRLWAEFTTELPADVVPLVPTATGSFAKPGSSSGDFPDLGPGLWVLHTGSANTTLLLNTVEIDAFGTTLFLGNVTAASFVSAKTPRWIGSGAARTIHYAFHSMGSWGGA